MAVIKASLEGWQASINLNIQQDAAKGFAYGVVHNRIYRERGNLAALFGAGTITEAEYETKTEILDLLTVETREALQADLPAIEWTQV